MIFVFPHESDNPNSSDSRIYFAGVSWDRGFSGGSGRISFDFQGKKGLLSDGFCSPPGIQSQQFGFSDCLVMDSISLFL
jgi:hypothetical protein